MEKASGKTAYKSGGVFTRETIGMTLILFSVLSIVLLLLSDVLFSTQWFYTRFLYGSFGYFSFALFASLTVIGGRMLADKRRRAEFRQALFVILFAIFAVGLVHVITAPLAPGSYGNYISDCYAKGSEGISTSTGGGAVFAAIVYPALKFITPIGCYILFSVLAVASVFAYFRATVKLEVRKTEKKYGKNKAEYSGFKPYPEGEFDFPEFSVRSSQLSTYSDKTSKGVTLFNNNGSGEFAHISRKERKSDEYRAFNIIDPIAKPKENEESTRKEYSRFNTEIFPTASYQSQTSGEILGRTNVVRTPYSFDEEEESSFEPNTRAVDSVLGENIVRRNPEEIRTVVDESTPFARVTPVQEGRTERSIAAKKPESEVIITEIGESKKVGEEHPFLKKSRSAAPDKSRLKPAETPADALSASANDNAGQPAGAVAERILSDDVETVSNTRKFNMGQPRKANYIESDTAEVNMPEDEKRKPAETPAEQIPLVEVNEYIGIPSMPIRYKYNKPPVELYKDNPQKLAAGDDNIEERCAIIEKTLDNFGVPAQVENVISGPTITRYEISIPEGISVNKVPPRASDLAMRLAVESVRIEAPIPGKNLIGIEVPNKVKQMVGMKELLLEKAYQKSSPEALSIVLGEDVVGNPIITDLTKTPHLLVAGATGMGKSVFLNALIMSLITKYGPNDLRLILVDPKQVEFTIYENIPHLLVNKILTEASECIAMLDWAIDEMELRYKIFRTCYAQKIEEYNNSIDTKIKRKMPKIVIIIDELGDLFSMSAQIKHDIEDRIKRLTQKARAAGIHVVVATQRPDVTVITGVIKTNLPSRIAFKVLNYEDSRTILSDGGAEKLLGNGDMIFKTSTSALLLRIQGAYVSKDEIVRVLNYIKSNNQCYYDDNAKKYLDAKKASTQNGGYAASATFGDGEGDSGQSAKTFNNIPIRNIKALKAVIERKQASISLLQRCLSVGYATAGKMIDWMESMKYVTPFDGSKARNVLISMDEFERLYGEAELD